MKLYFTEQFNRRFAEIPLKTQRIFHKQARLLVGNFRHASLQAKKYRYDKKLSAWIWQARVTRKWRFYFTIETDTYQLLSIIPHPK